MESLKDLLKPEILWFAVGVLLLIFEMGMPGLIIGFFGVGAILTGVLTLIVHTSINFQILFFIISSVLLLVSLRRYLTRVFKGRIKPTGETNDDQEYVGEKVVVVESIKPEKPGKVELHGTHWKAESEEELSKGTRVVIVSKAGITLTVKSV